MDTYAHTVSTRCMTRSAPCFSKSFSARGKYTGPPCGINAAEPWQRLREERRTAKSSSSATMTDFQALEGLYCDSKSFLATEIGSQSINCSRYRSRWPGQRRGPRTSAVGQSTFGNTGVLVSETPLNCFARVLFSSLVLECQSSILSPANSSTSPGASFDSAVGGDRD